MWLRYFTLSWPFRPWKSEISQSHLSEMFRWTQTHATWTHFRVFGSHHLYNTLLATEAYGFMRSLNPTSTWNYWNLIGPHHMSTLHKWCHEFRWDSLSSIGMLKGTLLMVLMLNWFWIWIWYILYWIYMICYYRQVMLVVDYCTVHGGQ